MKNLKSIIGLVLMALALLTAGIVETGCGSAPKVAYQSTSVTTITADAAMSAWGNYVAQFHPPAAEEQKVKDAFDKYRAAALVVTSAGAALANGTGNQSALDTAIAVAAGSLSDLINAVQSFGIKIPTK